MDSFEEEQERHRRRMVLMQEIGKTNRMETRLHILWMITATLIVVTVLLMCFA